MWSYSISSKVFKTVLLSLYSANESMILVYQHCLTHCIGSELKAELFSNCYSFIVHKCLYHRSPNYLNELLLLTNNFDRTGNLITLKCNFSSTNGALAVCAPQLWNALPTDLKFETSTTLFKTKLKTHLFITFMYWTILILFIIALSCQRQL